MPTPPTVLLVDDDEAARYLSCRLLRRLGLPELQVYQAVNGQEALLLLQATCAAGQPLPDLLLIDVNMPVLNGLELLAHYAQLPTAARRHSTAVMLSSSDQPLDVAAACGVAAEFIVKPLSEGTLRRLLHQYAHYPAVA